MLKNLSIVGGALAIAMMAAVAVGGAFAGHASAEERDGTFLAGTGHLEARGDGLVAVKGRMNYEASADRGILLVKDLHGDMVIDVEGEGDCDVRWYGFIVCFGTGSAQIRGSHVAVILVGKDLNVDVEGRGWAFLKGRGQFWVNGHGPFPWNPDGGFASVTPEEDEAP